MTDSIIPSPELIGTWLAEAAELKLPIPANIDYIATRAAQWGADQELEACCLELVDGIGRLHAEFPSCLADDLRAARRPKPPSLKEQALEALVSINSNFHVYGADIDTIRRALEALPE